MTPERSSPEHRSGDPMGPDHNAWGKYKYETRESFVKYVPNVQERIQKYKELHRTPHEDDVDELRNQRAVERIGKLEGISDRRLKLDALLSEKIRTAPAATRQEWVALRAKFEQDFDALRTQYLNAEKLVSQDYAARGFRFATQAETNTFVQPAEADLKNSILDRFTILTNGVARSIVVSEQRQERDRQQDERRAAELYETTEKCKSDFDALTKASYASASPEIVRHLQKAAADYMQAIRTEGSFLYGNLRGFDFVPKGGTHIDADVRITDLLCERQKTSLYLSETFADKYRGTPETVNAVSRYSEYLMRNPTQVDAVTLQDALHAEQEELRHMAHRTYEAETADVKDALDADTDALPKLEKDTLKKYQAALSAYLTQIRTEGRYLHRSHRDMHAPRIGVLKDRQEKVVQTLRIVEEGLNPEKQAQHMSISELYNIEKNNPLNSKDYESLNREDEITMTLAQKSMQAELQTDTIQNIAAALTAVRSFHASLNKVYGPRYDHPTYLAHAPRLTALAHKLEALKMDKEKQAVIEQYESTYMENASYKNTTDISVIQGMDTSKKEALNITLKAERVRFTYSPLLAQEYPSRLKALDTALRYLSR